MDSRKDCYELLERMFDCDSNIEYDDEEDPDAYRDEYRAAWFSYIKEFEEC